MAALRPRTREVHPRPNLRHHNTSAPFRSISRLRVLWPGRRRARPSVLGYAKPYYHPMIVGRGTVETCARHAPLQQITLGTPAGRHRAAHALERNDALREAERLGGRREQEERARAVGERAGAVGAGRMHRLGERQPAQVCAERTARRLVRDDEDGREALLDLENARLEAAHE
eukprot:1817005-Prymnesium_polylepis.1